MIGSPVLARPTFLRNRHFGWHCRVNSVSRACASVVGLVIGQRGQFCSSWLGWEGDRSTGDKFFSIYSYFEKGCRIKCTRQPRKVLWVVLSSLFFQRNLVEWQERPWTVCLWVLKESNKSRFDRYSVRNSVLNISYITFRDCRVHIFSDNLSRNSCKRGLKDVSGEKSIYV